MNYRTTRPGYRYGTKRISKKGRVRRSYSRVPKKDFKTKVVQHILSLDKRYFTKEEVAAHFNVKPHEVENIFRELNLDGFLNQPDHSITTDSYFSGNRIDWAGDTYSIRED